MRSLWIDRGHCHRPERPLSARPPLPVSQACVVIVGLSALAWGIFIGVVLTLVAVV